MIKFNSKYGASLNEKTNLVSIMDEDKELFTLSKANVESILDLFGNSTTLEQFDPITKWELDHPEDFAAAKDKFCCLHVQKQEVIIADQYDDVVSQAISKYGSDEVETNCYFFQGPKSPYKIHTIDGNIDPE